MKFYVPVFLAVCTLFPPHSHAGGSYAGRYEGKWGKPGGIKYRDADTGVPFEGDVLKADIMLRIPRNGGRRNGTVDASIFSKSEPGTAVARLLCDFAKPEIRRGGKKIIYDARANWKLAPVVPTNNIPGTLRLKIVKRGNYIIKRGNLQLFFFDDPAPSAKMTGQIRASK